MSKDNGKEPELTEEQKRKNIAEQRSKRYQEDPEAFTENCDLIFAAKRMPEGEIALLLAPITKSELYRANGDLQFKIMKFLEMKEVEEYTNKKILPAKGGLVNFVRGMGRKG